MRGAIRRASLAHGLRPQSCVARRMALSKRSASKVPVILNVASLAVSTLLKVPSLSRDSWPAATVLRSASNGPEQVQRVEGADNFLMLTCRPFQIRTRVDSSRKCRFRSHPCNHFGRNWTLPPSSGLPVGHAIACRSDCWIAKSARNSVPYIHGGSERNLRNCETNCAPSIQCFDLAQGPVLVEGLMALRPLSVAARRMALSKRSASKVPVNPEAGCALLLQDPERVVRLRALRLTP